MKKVHILEKLLDRT